MTNIQVPYSLGFAFSEDRKQLVVITKNRPAWQAGKWNGVGGHIEEGESPLECLVREFWEETNVTTDVSDWHPLVEFSSEFFTVSAFYLFSDKVLEARTMTDEEISIIPVNLDEIMKHGQTNLAWLVALALDTDIQRISATVHYSSE